MTNEMTALLHDHARLVAALREAREYILDNGDERTMAPVIERIDDVLGPVVELPSRHPDTERLDYLDSRLQLGHRFTMGSYPQPDIAAKTIRELIDKMRGGAAEPAGGCIHCGGEHE